MTSTASIRGYNGRFTNRLDVAGTFTVGQSASTPNYIEGTGAAANSSPIIAAKGSDGSIVLSLASKGDAPVRLMSNNLRVAEFTSPVSSVNALWVSGSTTGNPVLIKTVGSDANCGITIQPSGIGNVTVTGPAVFLNNVTLSTTPISANHATTKAYVDAAVLSGSGIDLSSYIKKSGNADAVMTGHLTLVSSAPTAPWHAVPLNYLEDSLEAISNIDMSGYLLKSGGIMTGLLSLSGPPTDNSHAATKLYVDTANSLAVLKGGSTMTGPLTLSGAPTNSLHASTKQYVDDREAAMTASFETTFFPIFISGAPASGGKHVIFAARAFRLSANFSGCRAMALTPSTGTVDFTIKRNGSSTVGTLTFAASGSGTFSSSTMTTFSNGDYLTIEFPPSADATLADVAISFRVTWA